MSEDVRKSGLGRRQKVNQTNEREDSSVGGSSKEY